MSGQAQKFKIVTSGYYSCSMEEWLRSCKAPASELPRLTASQKQFALKFGVPEQEYARFLLANRYGRDRIVRGAQELGRTIEHILSKVENGCRLLAIKADLTDGPRVVWLQTEQGIKEVDVSPALATALLRRGQLEKTDQEKLESMLLAHLGRTQLAGRKQRR